MKTNVLAYKEAVSRGFCPGEYAYQAALVPVGVYEARLVQKIWAKNAVAISCYFITEAAAQKIQLTVYCRYGEGVYRLRASSVDFTSCPVGEVYLVQTSLNNRGRIVFDQATLKKNNSRLNAGYESPT